MYGIKDKKLFYLKKGYLRIAKANYVLKSLRVRHPSRHVRRPEVKGRCQGRYQGDRQRHRFPRALRRQDPAGPEPERSYPIAKRTLRRLLSRRPLIESAFGRHRKDRRRR